LGFCDIIKIMKKEKRREILSKFKGLTLPLFVEKDEDGFYVVECPILEGC
jgi:hypothetical protein